LLKLNKRRLYKAVAFIIFIGIVSCKGDDDAYVPLEIVTQADSFMVSSLETITISVLNNDTNVPEEGILSFNAASNGVVSKNDQGTPADVRDDSFTYDPDNDFDGVDTFQYTICNELGSGCKTETVTITVAIASPIRVDLVRFPYDTLSSYGFFSDNLSAFNPVFGLLPFEPITPLFTNYAKKARFVYVPEGSKATYNGDGNSLSFPVGSALVKVFYYDNVLPENQRHIIETRVMVKKSSGWEFAEYIWNEEQTEAFLDESGNGGFTQVEWIQDGEERFVNYRIPAQTQCIVCHTNDLVTIPLGIKPQNINSNYAYESGTANQLDKLIEEGFLEDALPSTINTVVDWEDINESLLDRSRAYLDINCGNCHSAGGQADYRSLRLLYNDTDNNSDSLGICIDADTEIPGFPGTKLFAPGDAANSINLYRMEIVDSQFTMPQFGRNLSHDEGLQLIEEWINSLNTTCD
jgi:uncharacterized repeat protein (TIGR03806 family)